MQNNLWTLPSPMHFAPPTPTLCIELPTLPTLLMAKAGDHYLSHLNGQNVIMCQPYALVSGITKKCLQPIDARKECVLVQCFAFSHVKNELEVWLVRNCYSHIKTKPNKVSPFKLRNKS